MIYDSFMRNPTFIYKPYSLKLKTPFGTAHGTRSTTEGMIVAISADEFIGYGEAFMPPYYDEHQASMTAFFKRFDIEKCLTFDSLEDSLSYVDNIAVGNSAAKAAIDIALHDLTGKKLGKPVRKIFGDAKPTPTETSFTIGIDTAENMVGKALEAKEFKTLKIKLSGKNDVEIISAIADVTDQKLFVDANQAWTDAEEALHISRRLTKLGVALIEQPFAKGELEKAKFLKENIDVPVIADEDVQGFSDVEKLAEFYDGINIKLMKCGGLHKAFRMIKKARAYGTNVLLGCMTESSIGISAAAQLAGYVDWCDLDGNLLIKNDTCEGIGCVDGFLIPRETSGIGITDDHSLRELFKIPKPLT